MLVLIQFDNNLNRKRKRRRKNNREDMLMFVLFFRIERDSQIRIILSNMRLKTEWWCKVNFILGKSNETGTKLKQTK